MTSKHFIQQYFMSFETDPIIRKAKSQKEAAPSEVENGEENGEDNEEAHINGDR